jgi:iron(III) transport system substrate-binding protein
VLGLLLAVAQGCAPASSPTTAARAPAAGEPASASAPAADDPWQQAVASANRESKLRVIVPPGEARRDGVQRFQAAYPGIQIEMDSMHIRDAVGRILKEREAGIYSYDAIIGAIGADVFQQWIPAGVLDPLRPRLLLPEIVDEAQWSDGFAAGWMDAAKQHIYAFAFNVSASISINRDTIAERDFPDPVSFDQLPDPRWKGRIAWDDPRQSGAGVSVATLILLHRGEEMLRRLLVDQEIVPTGDNRQLAEWLVRGRYPIAFGASTAHIDVFQKEGLGLSVQQVEIKEGGTAAPGFGEVSVFNGAPHPNAATVFANWLLSREGQAAYMPLSLENSRRLDVPASDPPRAPKRGVAYVNTQQEEFAAVRTRAAQIARDVLR